MAELSEFEVEDRREKRSKIYSYAERMVLFHTEMVRQTAEGLVMKPKPTISLCKYHDQPHK